MEEEQDNPAQPTASQVQHACHFIENNYQFIATTCCTTATTTEKTTKQTIKYGSVCGRLFGSYLPPPNPSFIYALQYRKYCDELSSEAHDDDDVVP